MGVNWGVDQLPVDLVNSVMSHDRPSERDQLATPSMPTAPMAFIAVRSYRL